MSLFEERLNSYVNMINEAASKAVSYRAFEGRESSGLDKMLEAMSWSEFVSGILPKKAELIEYLKLKRLYVNEPAEETEEM